MPDSHHNSMKVKLTVQIHSSRLNATSTISRVPLFGQNVCRHARDPRKCISHFLASTPGRSPKKAPSSIIHQPPHRTLLRTPMLHILNQHLSLPRISTRPRLQRFKVLPRCPTTIPLLLLPILPRKCPLWRRRRRLLVILLMLIPCLIPKESKSQIPARKTSKN